MFKKITHFIFVNSDAMLEYLGAPATSEPGELSVSTSSTIGDFSSGVYLYKLWNPSGSKMIRNEKVVRIASVIFYAQQVSVGP